jgi:hypothetical protein
LEIERDGLMAKVKAIVGKSEGFLKAEVDLVTAQEGKKKGKKEVNNELRDMEERRC